MVIAGCSLTGTGRYIYERARRLCGQVPELAQFTIDLPPSPAAKRGLVFGQRLRDLFRRAWTYAHISVRWTEDQFVRHPVLGYLSHRDEYYLSRAMALVDALPELEDIIIFKGRAHSQRKWQAMVEAGIDVRAMIKAGTDPRTQSRR